MRLKILITVKAYPALSKKYNETVCTAGITEEGNWIRIYPIPFRKLKYDKQFKDISGLNLTWKKIPAILGRNLIGQKTCIC